jgi:SsrA-binding protein
MQGKSIFSNRRAYFDYDVVDTLTVGIALYGWEVKSMKAGHLNFQDAYVQYDENGELILKSGLISAWKTAPLVSQDLQRRDRKLLAHKSEAVRIGELSRRPGYTMVVLSGSVSDKGIIKLELAVVKGKKKFQKKQKIKERDLDREMRQDLKYMSQ